MADVSWPVELRHGPVGLRPLRVRDGSEWNAVRQRNLSWLRPWDATQPPGARGGAHSFRSMAREMDRQARQGRMLPFVVTYADERGKAPIVGQLTVSGITYGSASWASMGYWVDQSYAGLGIIPTAVAMAADHCWFTLFCTGSRSRSGRRTRRACGSWRNSASDMRAAGRDICTSTVIGATTTCSR